jgi:hypothetical protein
VKNKEIADMNHRCGHRFTTDRTIRIRTASGAVSIARLTDVSVSGAMINTVLDLPYMSRIKVQMTRGYDGDGSTREVDAYVIRRTPEGTGIEWEELNPRAVDELVRSLARAPAANSEPQKADHAVVRHGNLAMLPGIPMAYYRLH